VLARLAQLDPWPIMKPMNTKKALYKITFISHGKLYELYAREVRDSHLWGFCEVSEFVFDLHNGLIADPVEERLRTEFGNTKVLYLPMHSIGRVEEVERKEQSSIRDAASGEKVVTPFPLSAKPHPPRHQ